MFVCLVSWSVCLSVVSSFTSQAPIFSSSIGALWLTLNFGIFHIIVSYLSWVLILSPAVVGRRRPDDALPGVASYKVSHIPEDDRATQQDQKDMHARSDDVKSSVCGGGVSE